MTSALLLMRQIYQMTHRLPRSWHRLFWQQGRRRLCGMRVVTKMTTENLCREPRRSWRKCYFQNISAEDAIRSVSGLLTGLSQAKSSESGEAPLNLRAHLFFRNLQGLWVCTDDQVHRSANAARRVSFREATLRTEASLWMWVPRFRASLLRVLW